MNQRVFPILIFIVLPVALLAQCRTPAAQDRNATLTGVADDGTPTAMLFDAASVGSIDAEEEAARRGANINGKNAFGWTPLMIAVFYDQENSVRWLIKRGADVNACSETGVMPVLEAARVGDQTLLDDLIDAGCNIRAVDRSGRNTLILSVEGTHGTSVLQDLLARGLPADLPDSDGQTALMVAASCGNVPFAAMLLKSGANLHATDHAGHAPPEFAQMAHDDAMVRFLSSQ